MNKKGLIRLVSILSLTATLAACSSHTRQTFEPQTTVRVVTETVYPQLSQINVPETPELRDIEWDYPRDLKAEEVIRNTTVCKNVPVEEQDLEFWAECGQFPIDSNSNLFIGLDQENFNNLTYNMETMRQYINLLKGRIAIANDQRAEHERLAGRE